MTYAVPARLAHVVPQDRNQEPLVYLMPLPDGPPVVLTGSAALIWMAAAEGAEDVAADVAEAVGRTGADIEQDVRSYLGYLVKSGLLDVTD